MISSRLPVSKWKGITVAQAVTGLKQGLNVGADFATSIGTLALMSNSNPLATSFILGDLKEYNFPIEHDGRLSRADIYEGDNLHFNMGKWQQVLNYYTGSKTSLAAASKARYNRIQVQRALEGNKFMYGPRQLVLSYGETSLYLSTMADPVTGVAPVSYVNSLFGVYLHERKSSVPTLTPLNEQRKNACLMSWGGNLPRRRQTLLRLVQ